MKVRGGRGRDALYLNCAYMPMDSKGRVVILGDFNARVGRCYWAVR